MNDKTTPLRTHSIILIEDDNLFRDTIQSIIAVIEGFACIDTYADVEEFMKEIDKQPADIFWIDINLPDGSGIDLIKEIKKKYPKSLCLICTINDDEESIFRALKTGADGYILKSASLKKMRETLYDLVAGGSPMSAYVAKKVIQTFQQEPSKKENLMERLSKRELDVLELLSQGNTYKKVAETLNVSDETIKTHARNIYQKLQVNNRTEATMKYLKR
jgi:DNA-binding NarL/FixJ family response regulator